MLTKEGFYDLPPGMLATVVTSLEMTEKPLLSDLETPAETALQRCAQLSADDYRAIYRHVGQDWLWFSRLLISDEALTTIIHDDRVEVYRVFVAGQAEGLLELDYRRDGECEIAFFGLGAKHTGRGLGSWLMATTLNITWAEPIRRLWVHTCTFDHPNALSFYQRHGFVPFKQEVELVHDPRRNGTLPRDAARHIPMLGVDRAE